jgi:hypothetical protein
LRDVWREAAPRLKSRNKSRHNVVSPGGLRPTGAGVCYLLFGKRTCKPNSVQNLRPVTVIPLGEALPLALISDLPGGSGVIRSSLTASGRCRVRALLLARASLPIWSCSVWGLPCLRHYCRSGALLPHLFTLTTAWGSPLDWVHREVHQRRYVFCGTGRPQALKPASRTLSGTLPCGVRTFLSRFSPLSRRFAAATAQSSCHGIVYRESLTGTALIENRRCTNMGFR